MVLIPTPGKTEKGPMGLSQMTTLNPRPGLLRHQQYPKFPPQDKYSHRNSEDAPEMSPQVARQQKTAEALSPNQPTKGSISTLLTIIKAVIGLSDTPRFACAPTVPRTVCSSRQPR